MSTFQYRDKGPLFMHLIHAKYETRNAALLVTVFDDQAGTLRKLKKVETMRCMPQTKKLHAKKWMPPCYSISQFHCRYALTNRAPIVVIQQRHPYAFYYSIIITV